MLCAIIVAIFVYFFKKFSRVFYASYGGFFNEQFNTALTGLRSEDFDFSCVLEIVTIILQVSKFE